MFYRKKNISQLLTNYNLGRIVKITPIATSGNLAYRIFTARQEYFLRLSPEVRWRARSREDIAAEIEFLHYLKSHNIPVVVPVKMKNGEEIVHQGSQYGYLRKYCEARAKLRATASEVRRVGALLGKMHCLAEKFHQQYKRRLKFDLKSTQKYFTTHKVEFDQLGRGDDRELLEELRKELFALKFSSSLPHGLIHEDLGKRHVLWCKDQIKAVIDFDRCYDGVFVLDLGQALRGWCLKSNNFSWDLDKINAFLVGYESQRSLSLLEKKFLAPAVKFAFLERALSFYSQYIYSGDKKKLKDAKQCLILAKKELPLQ